MGDQGDYAGNVWTWENARQPGAPQPGDLVVVVHDAPPEAQLPGYGSALEGRVLRLDHVWHGSVCVYPWGVQYPGGLCDTVHAVRRPTELAAWAIGQPGCTHG